MPWDAAVLRRKRCRAKPGCFTVTSTEKTLPPTKIACAPLPPAPRQCTPPRPAHSLHRTRLRPRSAIRTRTQHVSCELLAATHTHNTLHCTCTFLHSAHNKRVMIFLDTASTTHAPRASNRFSHALRASTVLYCARTRNREHKWLHLCSLLRWHCNLTLCTVSCSRRITNSNWAGAEQYSCSAAFALERPAQRARQDRQQRRQWVRARVAFR